MIDPTTENEPELETPNSEDITIDDSLLDDIIGDKDNTTDLVADNITADDIDETETESTSLDDLEDDEDTEPEEDADAVDYDNFDDIDEL